MTRSVHLETQPAKKRPKGDAGCARNFLREDSHTVAHKDRPKGDTGRRPRHPTECAEHAQSQSRGTLALANFLRGTILWDMQSMPRVPQGQRRTLASINS
ncbi:hypothetical protein Prudu_791S000100, partial [Prunus dulcis]